jgi:hypothetical protein
MIRIDMHPNEFELAGSPGILPPATLDGFSREEKVKKVSSKEMENGDSSEPHVGEHFRIAGEMVVHQLEADRAKVAPRLEEVIEVGKELPMPV